MTDAVWPDVLDAFEQRLSAQEAALELGTGGAIPPFDPPASIPPLPQDLADRATALTQRCRQIEADLARALEAAGVALDRATTPTVQVAAEPVYFDSRV